FELTIPDAPPSKWFRRSKVRDSLFASDRRYYRVATDVVSKVATVPVMMDGGTGGVTALRLAIIDPNNPNGATGGSGTEEDPFRSLLDYTEEPDAFKSQFAIIFVKRRIDGTDINLDTTIDLFDRQALLGEGIVHSLTNLGIGSISLPGSTDGLAVPLLSNAGVAPGTNVVTLANANQVAGFTIDAGGTADGIVGLGIDGFSLNDLTIRNVNNGIRIVSNTTGVLGTNLGIVHDNVITGVGLGSTRGVSIEHTAGTLELSVSRNAISQFRGEDANGNGILDLSEDTNNNGKLDPGEDKDFDGILDLSEDLNNNGVLDRGYGIYVAASGTSIINSLDPISENVLTSNGTGSSVQALDSSLVLMNFFNNTATGSTDLLGAGFEFIADGGEINLQRFTGNTATGGAGDGAVFQTFNGGVIAVHDPLLPPSTAFTGNTFSSNAGDGMFVEANSGGILFDQIANSIFNNNGDDGLDMQTTNGGALQVTAALMGNTYNGNGDNGIELTGGIGGVLDVNIGTASSTTSSPITGNGGAGVFIGTTGGTLMTSLQGITSTGNGGSGAVISLDGGTVLLDGISNNVFTNNGENGLSIINNNGGTLITPFVADNNFSNNGQAGLFIGGTGPLPGVGVATTGRTDLGSVTRNNFNRDIRGTEGILFNANDQRILMTLTRNSFDGREPVDGEDPGAGRGIGGTIGGSSTGPGGPGGLSMVVGTAVVADSNSFTSNGDAHIGLILQGNTTNSITVENSQFNDAFDQPGTADFAGEGIHYILRNTATLTGYITDSTMSNNIGDGVLIEITGNNPAGNRPSMRAAELNNFMIVDNVISNNGSIDDSVLSSGVKIVRTERGQYNDLLIHNNTITGNTENGITIESSGANFLNLANMRADTVAITSNTVRNNLQDGIQFSLGSDADIAARLDGNLITQNGFGEVADSPREVGNGIQVREFIQQAKDSRSLTGLWTNNTITGNFDDGIDLSGYLGNYLVEVAEAGVYTVAPPAPGTQFPILGEVRSYGLVIGDVLLNPIPFRSSAGNLISGNLADGIDITGGGVMTIANNVITQNGTMRTLGNNPTLLAFHAGINIDPSELNQGIDVLLNARDPRDLPNDDFNPNLDAYRDVFIYSNLISLNNGDGIEFLSSQSIDAADSATGFGLTPETRMVIALNEITLNQARGIDILQRPGSGIPTGDDAQEVDELDRSSQDPDGVPQVILSGFVSADVSIIANHIKGNKQEGIYVVQTVDDGQNQVSPSNNVFGINGESISNNESLRAQGQIGDIGNIVQLRLDIHDNDIIGNGEQVLDLTGTGLVIRVGTSGGSGVFGGYPFFSADPNAGFQAFTANYFATDGFNAEDTNGDGVLDNDLDGDGFLDAAPVIGSGVSASITFNLLDGNFGNDILIHTFSSTVQPETSAGTWTPPTFDDMGMMTDPGEFTVDTYQVDPLARIDLIFSENHFNSIEPNNNDRTIGTSPGNAGEVDAGAYYNNAEAIFKSREPIPDMPGGGPFGPIGGGGERQRNATRFASRWVTGDGLAPFPPFTPENGAFKYPGLGNSTMRVRGVGNVYTDQGLGAVGLSQIFIFDNPALSGNPQLIDAFGEARGVFMSVGPTLNIGSLPWGWDVLEPGTPAEPVFFP
ncbi:MAG: right-handed parallel beta-helix repeat-containing protein, partial [Planctomycetaceae bacterium]|nr:right-handed parallel beta-helix repeat-containing protein [Planctomycetaceae bacterium]